MANVLADMLIRMGVDSAEVRKGLKTVESELKGFTRNVDRMRSALEGAFAVVGVNVLAQRLAGLVNRGAEAADRLGELSQSAGMGADAFSRLSYAAQFSGVEAEHLAHMLGFMSKSMSEAAMGAGHGADAFRVLGIQVADADGRLRNSREVLLEIADRFAGMEDGAAKTALTLGIFGKKGADIIPVLNRGSAALEAVADEGQRLGEIMGGEVITGADRYADALKRIDSLSITLGGTIAAELAPSLDRLVKLFVETADKAGGARTAAQDIAVALKMLGSVATATWGVLQTGAAHAAVPLAALALAAQGEFAAAGQALKNWGSSVDAEWERMKERLDAIWSPGLSGKLSRERAPPPAFEADGHKKPKADQAAKEAAKALAEQMKDFNALVDQAEAVMDSVASPAEAYALQLRDLGTLLAKGAIDQETHARAVEAAGNSYFEASGGAAALADEMSRFNAIVADAEAVMDSLAGPIDDYAAQMERLRQLLREGAIDQETFDRAAQNAAMALARSNEVLAGVANAGGQAFSALVDAAVSGGNVIEAVWDSILDSFLSMIEKMVAEWIQAQILMAGVSVATGGISAGAGGGAAGAVGGGAISNPFASVQLAQTAPQVGAGSLEQAAVGPSVEVNLNVQALDAASFDDYLGQNEGVLAARVSRLAYKGMI